MSKYWIQEYNEVGGNWIDYVGLDPLTTIMEAYETFLRVKNTKNRKFRLIVRSNTVIGV